MPESELEPEVLAALKTLRFAEGGADETVVEAARHGAGVKLRVERVTSPEAAKSLQGKCVWVDRALLPPPEPGSFYHFDILGLEAFAGGVAVGRVTRVEPVPGGVDRWWVKTATGEIAVPAARKYLKTIDPAAGRLDIEHWDELLALGH